MAEGGRPRWGRDAVVAYGELVDAQAAETTREIRFAGWMLCGLGGVFTIMTILVVVTAEVDIGPIAVGLALGVVAAVSLLAGRDCSAALAHGNGPKPPGEPARPTATAVGPCSGHWPTPGTHRAPTALLRGYACKGQERTTLTATVDGYPVLVQLLAAMTPSWLRPSKREHRQGRRVITAVDRPRRRSPEEAAELTWRLVICSFASSC